MKRLPQLQRHYQFWRSQGREPTRCLIGRYPPAQRIAVAQGPVPQLVVRVSRNTAGRYPNIAEKMAAGEDTAQEYRRAVVMRNILLAAVLFHLMASSSATAVES